MCSGFSCWMMKRLIRVCPVDNVKYKVKWPVGELAILGEGISFFMGCSKNYIMYWGGVTSIIVSPVVEKVCTNFVGVESLFCVLFLGIIMFYICSRTIHSGVGQNAVGGVYCFVVVCR